MRRLDILLIGHSQALTDLALELEQHGHSLVRLTAVDEQPLGNADLLIDDTSLPTVLKERALRLNRRRGGRPSSKTRTLRAVEALLEFARAGRTDAMDELRSIRALIEDREPRHTNS